MHTNRLIDEKSPYLIQHAHNPVAWHPWSDGAFRKAKTENKPIFLSVGYATCHWCHVMEKESFEDEEAAGYLNETFVCIKVDREERPDIDAVYMAACQMLTGSGGWPLNILLTPRKKPFFAATYLPKRSRFGRVGLIDLCVQVKALWLDQNEKIRISADSIAAQLEKAFTVSAAEEPDEALLDQAGSQIKRRFDPQHGGFESAPKFPMPHRLMLLLRRFHHREDRDALEMVIKTLTAMRLGGIWDHVGLGFHRYATDSHWLLPHFEKMLYDQALMAPVYLEAYQITRDPFFARTAEEILTYVLRDMTDSGGGFYSAEDADSDGQEGKFYLWGLEEFRQVLGPEVAGRWERILRLSSEGNFSDETTGRKTGANILHLTVPLVKWAENLNLPAEQLQAEWVRVRAELFNARKARPHPLKDDKILTDWNGLMIAALSMAARILNKNEYADAAGRSARFILSAMRDKDGRLFHRFRDGHLAVPAQSADYAFLIYGLLNLYQADFDLTFAEEAAKLQREMLADFWDEEAGGFFSTSEADGDLPVRPKDLYDGALPSANSVALHNLLLLGRLTGDPHWEERAHSLIGAFAGTVKSQPTSFTHFLCALDFALAAGQEVVVAGNSDAEDTRRLLTALNLNFAPHRIAVVKTGQNAGRLARFAGYTDGLQLIAEKAVAHLCRNGACSGTITDPKGLADRIAD